jgi:hypothetical protein
MGAAPAGETMRNVLVWDLETIPDLKGYAAAHGHDGKTDDEIRELLSCSRSRVLASRLIAAMRGLSVKRDVHGRKQHLKTPVQQALMRGLATA